MKKSDDGDSRQLQNTYNNIPGLLQNGRRTQSAIFRPLSNVAMSMSKIDHMSTQNLSNIWSSHFGLRPDSSVAGANAP